MNEEQAYQEVAKILVSNCPEDCRMIKYSFICLSGGENPDDGAFSHEFDYVNGEGVENWFNIPSGILTNSLYKYSVLIRAAMRDVSGALWNKMIFSVDMDKKSFKAEFCYQDSQ